MGLQDAAYGYVQDEYDGKRQAGKHPAHEKLAHGSTGDGAVENGDDAGGD